MSLRMKPPQGVDPQPAPAPPADAHKDADDPGWGGEPMTSAQASCLRTLSEEALEHEAFDETLTRAEAARRINALKAKLALMGEPPHVA